MGATWAVEQELSRSEYWDERHKTSTTTGDEPSHEWFKGFENLKPFITTHLLEPKRPDENPRVLHLGCGDSVSRKKHLFIRAQVKADRSSTCVEDLAS